MNNIIDKLQHLPYSTRVKILWGVVIACAAVLFVIWGLNIRGTLKGIDKNALIPQTTKSNIASNEVGKKLIDVERVEQTEASLKIFFNLENSTDDILNVSQLSDITLTIDDKTLQPTRLVDRQGNPFVQKLLSHSKEFGTITFTASPEARGTLIFDNMFFEQKQGELLKQTLDLNLKELNQKAKVRN